MSIARYPEYKDSGVEWLGQVPEHWDVKRLRFVAELNPSKSEVSNFDRDTLVSFLPMDAIGEDGSLSLDKEKPISELESGYTYFRDGDVTVAKITPCYENGKGALMQGLLNGIGFGTTELIVARPQAEEVTGPYLHYLFISPDFRSLGESHMYGAGGQKRVPDAFVRNFATAFPPVAEQTQIAAFLDRETAKIDVLVAEQRRLMALLKEKRQAVISHAVTRGLNPDAPMKPSGIEWLGDVPAHWGVTKIKRLVSVFEQGWSPQCEGFPVETEQEWGVLKVGCVNGGTFRPEENKTLPSELEPIPSLGIAMGDLLISRANTRELVGGAAVAKQDHANLLLCDKLYRLRFPQDICSPVLIALYLGTGMARGQIELAANGASSSMVNISQSTILELDLALPEFQEQLTIVEFLETEAAKFDTLTAEAQRAIDLLQERRTALISAAVTGQIDVRGVEKTHGA
jgi:type I restriction enzyme S subunit